uniref:Lipoprotein n=1 Tax=Phaselicystis flava TaxID=525924 RepID=A0A3S7V084_9BACT|nr:lipoprotein [Phaselicystis flava]
MPPTSNRRVAAALTLVGSALVAACSSSDGGATTGAGGGDTGGAGGAGGGSDARPADLPATKDLQGRAYELKVPEGFDGASKAPLLVMLHGYSPSPTAPQEMFEYMKMGPEAAKRGVFVALPRGTYDGILDRYTWNATESCCGFNNPEANDVGYVLAMIDEIKAKHPIDEKRVFLLGHSNGGFMAHRLACDQASQFAGIVSLAGATYKNPKKCAASAPIAVLQVHGDDDGTIAYDGGPPIGVATLPPAPGAEETVATWAAKNRCAEGPVAGEAIDLVTNLDGAETSKAAYEGCEANGATALWTIHGGPHVPKFNDSWAGVVLDFLMAHPKP